MRKLTLSIVVLLGAAIPLGAQRPVPSHPVAENGRLRPNEVARVNGVALSSVRLDAALGTLIPFESFHGKVTPAKMVELRNQALDRIVEEELQYQAGVRLRVRIPEQRLQQEVATVQAKYGSRAALLAALTGSGSTMADLRRELRRTLTAGEAARREVTAKCQVTRADARAFYADNPGRFEVPEQLHVYAITFGVDPSAGSAKWSEAKARADDVRRQIEGGASFEEMAREHTTDATKASGGDMGFVHRGSLVDEFEAAIRDLPLRQPSAPVQSLYGYHLVEVTEIRPPRQQTFSEVAATLERDLSAKRCEAMHVEWIARLRKQSTIVLADPTI